MASATKADDDEIGVCNPPTAAFSLSFVLTQGQLIIARATLAVPLPRSVACFLPNPKLL